MTVNNNPQKLLRAIDRNSKSSSFQRNLKPRLSQKEEQEIYYHNTDLLKRFLSEGGRILPRRITNLSAKTQRKMKKAVKIARLLGFLSFASVS